ncbi:hypothetical protein [Leifsonia sp. SIMBA_070]|uniref:hypothetical protein n=1 Tax=Leifsonia sp. SIMBA_070 TaxID=3085810 RepID=UPI00397A9FA7
MSDFEIPLGNTPKCGAELHLVRWVRVGGEWRAETLLVTYRAASHDEWLVEQHGQQQSLDRNQWLVFQP